MKCLLIFAVTIAVAAAGHLFDPSENDEVCMMCGDPVVRTYDGAYLMVFEPTKTLMTQWDDGSKDPCKLQVRCVTANSFIVDGLTEPTWVDWCGIAFWPHKSADKYFRNWLFSQSLDHFGERGQGYTGMIAIKSGDWPRTFPYAGENPDTWNTQVPRPACASEPYTAWIDQAESSLHFRSDSACCGWAVDLFVAGRKTCVNIYAESGRYSGSPHLDGICGNMDGDIANDWSMCDNGGQCAQNDQACLEAIATSCKDFTHDGQGYVGGTKLNNFN